MSEPSASTLGGIGQKLTHPSATLRAMLSGVVTVAGLTLVSKAISFVKDATVAHRFGVSHELDGFLLAFGLHTFITGMLAAGLPYAMMPAYSDVRHRLGDARADALALQSALCHALTLLLLGVAVHFWGEAIVGVMGKGFTPDVRALSRRLITDLLPFMFCYGMTTHLSMWLRGRKAFFAATASPIVTPLIIIALLALSPLSISADLLVLATNIGGALHLLFISLTVGRFLPLGSLDWWRSLRHWEEENATILRNALPYLVAGLVLGATTLVDQTMAGWLAPGSVSTLSYSDKVCGILLALTAIAASEAMFPFFSDVVARGEWGKLHRQLKKTLQVVVAFAAPLTAILIWQAPLIVALLFERGAFTAEHTHRVAEVLRFAALQIPFYVIGVMLSRIVVALQGSGFTLLLSWFSLMLNIGLNALLMRSMGVAGIALSTAFVYFVSATAMWIYVSKKIAQRRECEEVPS